MYRPPYRSNRYYAGINVVNSDASSTCEVLYELITDEEKFQIYLVNRILGTVLIDFPVRKNLGLR